MDPFRRELFITNRRRAGERLMSRRTGARIRHVLSIDDPGSRPPTGFHERRSKLRLEFHDVQHDTQHTIAPDTRDILAIIAFARAIAEQPGGLLVHCQAGISRSTASALIILATWTEPGQEFTCAEHVRRLRPQARPHAGMLVMADARLKRCGALAKVWQQN